MSVTPIRDTDAENLVLQKKTKLGSTIKTLGGNLTLTIEDSTAQNLDPGGSSRNVTLPAVAVSRDLFFLVNNTADAAENLVMKNAGGDTICTIGQNLSGLLHCDGVVWKGLTPAAQTALTGSNVSAVAQNNVVGGVPVIHQVLIAAGALADTDVVLTNKTRVINAWLVLKGAGVSTTTLQVKNGTSAITDAMAASGSDKAVVRAASIDDATWEIAAGGTLRVTSATGATQPDAIVFVEGLVVT